MTEHGGMTVVPAIYTDAEGKEHLSYEHSHVVSHGERLEVQADALENQAEYFSIDNNGEVEHAYDIGEEGSDAWVDSIFDEDADEYDEEYDDDEEDFSGIFEELISEDNYDVLIEWAAENLSDENIDEYDEIMDSGDYDRIYRAVEILIDAYESNQTYY